MNKTYKNKIDQITGIYKVAIKTPISFIKKLSSKLKNEILLKREDLQQIYSFKIRGAYNKIQNLSKEQKKNGIITVSAGNHAQGVALAANQLNIKANIIMPITTPQIKIDSVNSFGANIILYGDTFNEAYKYTINNSKFSHLTFIHPYDDDEVILGQGTIGKEINEQVKNLDYIFIPVGGGGLISGIACYMKEASPNTKIIGVESDESACLQMAMKAGKRVKLDKIGIFADGVAVDIIGKNTFKFCQKYVDQVITVTTDEICAAIKDTFNETRSIPEPAGAIALAGLKKFIDEKNLKNKKLIAIQSGANINFDRLRHISERTEIGEKKESLFAITLKEKKGSLLNLCNQLLNYNITEFSYRHFDESKANIFIGINIPTQDKKKKLYDLLKNKFRYPIKDLTNNEMAKVHIRYTVGGKNFNITNELFYSFQFPERPNALLNFLVKMQMRWNISMFHYRNHGAIFGRVLMAIQDKKNEIDEIESFFKTTGYNYNNESNNEACKYFL